MRSERSVITLHSEGWGSVSISIRQLSGANPPAWEQRRLGELYEKCDERNDGSLGYDKTLSVSQMAYKQEGNGAAESSLNSYKVLRKGDVAFEGHTSKEFRYGRFVLNDAGTGLMSPRFTYLRPTVEQDFRFWKYFIHHEPTMRPVLVRSTKAGTMMNELVVDDLLRESIPVPLLPEQRRIGGLFSALDSLITLHQRKLNAHRVRVGPSRERRTG